MTFRGNPGGSGGFGCPPTFSLPLVVPGGGGDKSFFCNVSDTLIGMIPDCFRAWPSRNSKGRPKVGRGMVECHPSRLTDIQGVPAAGTAARELGGRDGLFSVPPANEGFLGDGIGPDFGSSGCLQLVEPDRGLSVKASWGRANGVGRVVVGFPKIKIRDIGSMGARRRELQQGGEGRRSHGGARDNLRYFLCAKRF